MSFPTFDEFFRSCTDDPDVREHGPFPWQQFLAERACAGDWPEEIDIPTGFGKTTTLLVAVYAAAFQAQRRGRRTTPQRIIHVVDRRQVIDQTYRGLTRLPERMLSVHGLSPVSQALLRLAGGWSASPDRAANRLTGGRASVAPDGLIVGRIHGENADDRRWLRPTGVSVVSMTPQQLVSRLLFRGYGVSARTRSIHAGLLGVDALIVIDEPQLCAQAVETVRRVLALQADAPGDLGVPASRMVLLGATIRKLSSSSSGSGAEGTPSGSNDPDDGHRVLRLQDADLRHPRAIKLLTAPRPIRLVRTATSDRAVRTAIVNAYVSHRTATTTGRRIAIIVNTVAMAQEIYREILNVDPEAVLLTSRMRPTDRAATDPSRSPDQNWDQLTVVATQCLEVGVDLSFDIVITEACPYPSLVQRIGRLNRRGDSVDPQGILVLGVTPSSIRKATEVVYGKELVEVTNKLLEALARRSRDDNEIDLSLGRQLELRESSESDGCWPEVPRLATLHAGYLGVMASTYPTPWSDLPVDQFIVAPDDHKSVDVLVAWRHDLGALAKCPPLPAEQVSVPLSAVRAKLSGRTAVDIADLDLGPDVDNAVTSAPIPAAGVRVLRDDDWKSASSSDIRPGDVLVIASRHGGYTPRLGWTPTSTAEVPDHALVAALEASGVPTPFPVSRQTLQPWLHRHGQINGDDPGVAASSSLLTTVDQIVADRETLLTADIRDRLQAVAPEGLDVANWTFSIVDPPAEGSTIGSLIAERPNNKSGKKNQGAQPVLLDDHQEQVRDLAERACIAAGVANNVAGVVQRAALWHDEGKRVAHFQAYLGNDDPSIRWAKSLRGQLRAAAERTAAELVGHPTGWRHDGMGAHLCAEAGCESLLVHLVGAHQGRFRPRLNSAAVGEGQGELSDRAEAFTTLNQEWGLWGLAYLETVLRLADWYASEYPHRPMTPAAPHPIAPEQPARADFPRRRADPGTEVILKGLLPTPVTGWYALAGLLRVAYDAGDRGASIRWLHEEALPPMAPLWRSDLPLKEACRLLLRSEQWALLRKYGSHLQHPGFARKNQKVVSTTQLSSLLDAAAAEGAWLVTGLLQDAARESPADAVQLSIPAQANNSSYVTTAMVGREASATDLAACLTDPLMGWTEQKCDGGMDRPRVDDGVVGREVKDHRMIRTQLASAALVGMASMGTVGFDGVGVRGRTLQLPLPRDFTSWPELVALTHAVELDTGWVLRCQIDNIGYERFWMGRPVRLRDRRQSKEI